MWSLRKKHHERAGFALYAASVTASRMPWYFSELAVPDTLDGRFDLVSLFVAVLIRHLRHLPAPGPGLAQAVFDAMFLDMDSNLRELGVGDMSIAKRVRQMWEAFHGRALAYEAALDTQDIAGLADAIGRNVWRGSPQGAQADILARIMTRQDHYIRTQALADFTAGRVRFLTADEARDAA